MADDRVTGGKLADNAFSGDQTDEIARRLEIALYVRQLARELSVLANGSRFETVAHLLEMTRLQAQQDIDELKKRIRMV